MGKKKKKKQDTPEQEKARKEAEEKKEEGEKQEAPKQERTGEEEKKKKTKETEEQKKARREAEKLIESVDWWAVQAGEFIQKQNDMINFCKITLPKYEERLENEKTSYDENELSAEDISGDPEREWFEKCNEMSNLIDEADKRYQKYQEYEGFLEKQLENKHLSDGEKTKLQRKKEKLDTLGEQVRNQNFCILQYYCNLKLNSLIESLYKDGARSRELIRSVKQTIDHTKKQIDALKNRPKLLSVDHLKKEIDRQTELNRQSILRLYEESNGLHRARSAPCSQIGFIRDCMGSDYSPLKVLEEKLDEFERQNENLKNNIDAMIKAGNELEALNKELLAQKAALCEAEKKGDEKKEKLPTPKETTPSDTTRSSGKPKMIHLFGKKEKFRFSSYFGAKKGKPELLLRPGNPPKKQLFLSAQKKLNLKSDVKKEKTLRLPFYPKKLKKEKLDLETIMEESFELNQREQKPDRFLMENPLFKRCPSEAKRH